MNENIVVMENIHKSFGAGDVLKGVDFKLRKGCIHALLGENGTGKTKLMNILAGILKKDSGEIIFNGTNQKEVAFIHQELALVNDLTVFENIYLGNEIKKGLFNDKQKMIENTKQVLNKMNVNITPQTIVRELNPSHKQIVEIAKALIKDSKIIIMDEPTTSLTDTEIEYVFSIMKGLKNKGVSFIFISHKLNEVIEICDDYTVMRDGVVVSQGEITKDITENILAEYMVGKKLNYSDIYKKRKIGEVILEIDNLSRERDFNNININLKKGEIIGVTGLLGDGRSELFETVYGYRKGYSGNIFINGKKENMNSTEKSKNLGICYVPKNRKENGIIKDMSIKENIVISILKNISDFSILNKNKINQNCNKYSKEFNIKYGKLDDSITSLSGGNQQKVILSRALSTNPQIVILDNPTQGVDIGAKLEIYNIIMDLAQKGTSFVVLSNEFQEIMMVCDRVYVMFHGNVQGEFIREDITEEKLMIMATGGKI